MTAAAPSVDEITAETLESIKKATTAGVTSGTGIQGVDLSDLISLVPVNTPFRDILPRKKPKQGAKLAEWRALVNINNAQPDPATPFDYAAALVLLDEVDVGAYYGKVGAGYTVTQDSIDIASGYADAKAIAVMNAMNQFKIGEDKKAIGGCNFALVRPGSPTVAASTTGGSIPASTTVAVVVAARTASNYFYGGSTAASAAAGSVTTSAGGGTNSVTASIAAIRGAVAYDWYVGGFYYTTTTVNSVTITSVPGANQPVPNLPDLYAVAPTAVPAVDSSAKANDFNGLLASLAGDYATGGAFGLVTPGTGTPSGAYFNSLNGAGFTLSGANVAELDNMNQSIYDSVRLSPDAYMVSSKQATELSSAILSSNASETFFQPNLAGRSDAVLGAFVGWYVNKAAGGTPIKIEVHPHLPPGTLIARTDRVPFPNSNITNVCEMRTLRDLADYPYASARILNTAGGGPRDDGEVYANETFINRAPVAMGVLQNIA